jgi:hypothetical protein
MQIKWKDTCSFFVCNWWLIAGTASQGCTEHVEIKDLGVLDGESAAGGRSIVVVFLVFNRKGSFCEL